MANDDTPPDSDHLDALGRAQELARRYAALGAQDWQLDEQAALETGEIPLAEAIEPEPIPLAEEVIIPQAEAASATLPAELVDEPAVPPTALQIVEAILFVGGPPVRFTQVRDAIRGLTEGQYKETIDSLNRLYQAQRRPYHIVHQGDGYVMRVTPRYSGLQEKISGGPKETRLTQPALDVLSLVAYRQPIPKSEVDNLRGSDSTSYLRQLVRLGLISSTSQGEGDQKMLYYQTTDQFLEIFRLRDIDDLPTMGLTKEM